jgi:dTDP-4-amino-4,6-dideoxygalactose transaminase
MIRLFKVHMPKSVDERLLETLHSGMIAQGQKVKEFEDKLKEYFGNNNVLTVNSATSALFLTLRLCNIQPGDEIISTPMTCLATNVAIPNFGAKVVWADIDPITGLIDPESIEENITDKTKAIIVVHYGGNPCDMDRINLIAKKYNIKVIEDAAHALGSEYKRIKIGNHSDFVIFSLQAIKHITTIEGGILVCKNEDNYKRAKLLRWYGIDREKSSYYNKLENDVADYGYKFNFNDVFATIGLEQLKYLDDIVNKHIDNKKFYDSQFEDNEIIKISKLNYEHKSASWLYIIHIPFRDYFIRYMSEKGIEVSKVHYRNDRYSIFKNSRKHLPNVDKFFTSQVAIPVGWWITKEDREYIVKTIKEYIKMVYNG